MANVELKTASGGSVTLVPEDGVNNVTATVPNNEGTLLVAENTTTSSQNTVTNKISVEINGVTYYLLASTSGV